MGGGRGTVNNLRLWIVCPSYRDVPSFTQLRERILDVVPRYVSLALSDVRFVVIDDTAGFRPGDRIVARSR